MTLFEQVIRYLESHKWQRERRRRQRMLAKAMPRVVYRQKKIELARKSHRPCKRLLKEQQAEVLAALRGQ